MVLISLFRHAKSSWDNPKFRDFDRPLSPRGIRATEKMGVYIRANDLAPDLVLCSAALRTRQTLAGLKPYFSITPQVIFSKNVYMASYDELLMKLRKTNNTVRHVMILGHNPGLHTLAELLAFTGQDEEIKALHAKFPTAALAVIEFDISDWRKISTNNGTLLHFMTPKRLKLRERHQ